MDAAKREAILAKLQAHRVAFLELLPEKLAKIQQDWHTLTTQHGSAGTLSTLHRMVHSLAGSGATFGLPKVGEAAHTMAMLLADFDKSGTSPTPRQQQQIQRSLAALSALIQESVTPPQAQHRDSPETVPAPLAHHEPPPHTPVIIVDPDTELANRLAEEIACFGYTVVHLTTLRTLKEATERHDPTAIIVDVALLDGEGRPYIQEIERTQPHPLPLIVLSTQEDLPTRLHVAEAGGQAFFRKPPNVSLLLDTLDRMTSQKSAGPYRVIIVDASHALAEYYALILHNAGMETRIVTDPLRTLHVLQPFYPDLILLDPSIPHCSGVSLAITIHHQQPFKQIPTLFVSHERDRDQPLATVRTAGDGVLNKPVKPEHLVRAVRAHAARYRERLALITRDGLTGTLNHTYIMNTLAIELGKARESQKTVAFALMDIDHLAQINQNHGYSAGDQVIKNLGRLLKHRLHPPNQIGRHSGGCFAIVLPGTTENRAYAQLDRIRQDFSQIVHPYTGDARHASCSCGIAFFPTWANRNMLSRATEEALQRAKSQGKNRIEQAISHAPLTGFSTQPTL